jgi:hypothetical protein
MSNSDTSGFGKFVPGFDFLQNLAKNASNGLSGGASTPGLPNLSQWLVPSLNVEDLEKRIEELKHVQFWLEQNSRALAATIQALEVQKLTMATLKGMNFTMGMPTAPEKTTPSTASGWPMAGATAPKAEPAKAPAAATEKPAAAPTEAAEKPASGVIDPLQLWGSLTQQFQTIAANAFKEVSEKAAPGAAKPPASRKSAAKKPTGQTSGGRSTAAKKVATKPTKTSAAASRRST